MAIELENILGLAIRSLNDDKILAVLRHGELTIGRADDNNLVIELPTVSAYHARIYTYLTASYIEDLDSTNGTYVDGKRIKNHILKPGSVIRMGTCELVMEKYSDVKMQKPTADTLTG